MDRIDTDDIKVDAFIALLRAADILDKYLEIQLANYPLSRTEYILMTALKLHGGRMRPTDLSNHVFRAKHTISGLINSLEKKGLTRREIDGKDRRSLQVSLTTQGWELIEQIWLTRRDTARRAMSCFDEQEVERMKEDLNTLREHLLNRINNIEGVKHDENKKKLTIGLN